MLPTLSCHTTRRQGKQRPGPRRCAARGPRAPWPTPTSWDCRQTWRSSTRSVPTWPGARCALHAAKQAHEQTRGFGDIQAEKHQLAAVMQGIGQSVGEAAARTELAGLLERRARLVGVELRPGAVAQGTFSCCAAQGTGGTQGTSARRRFGCSPFLFPEIPVASALGEQEWGTARFKIAPLFPVFPVFPQKQPHRP